MGHEPPFEFPFLGVLRNRQEPERVGVLQQTAAALPVWAWESGAGPASTGHRSDRWGILRVSCPFLRPKQGARFTFHTGSKGYYGGSLTTESQNSSTDLTNPVNSSKPIGLIK